MQDAGCCCNWAPTTTVVTIFECRCLLIMIENEIKYVYLKKAEPTSALEETERRKEEAMCVFLNS